MVGIVSIDKFREFLGKIDPSEVMSLSSRLQAGDAVFDRAAVERSTSVGPFEEAVTSELAERLRAAVGRLSEQQAAVFTLVTFEHQTRDEVAATLGISPQAVSTALYKARERLMSDLAVFQRGERS